MISAPQGPSNDDLSPQELQKLADILTEPSFGVINFCARCATHYDLIEARRAVDRVRWFEYFQYMRWKHSVTWEPGEYSMPNQYRYEVKVVVDDDEDGPYVEEHVDLNIAMARLVICIEENR